VGVRGIGPQLAERSNVSITSAPVPTRMWRTRSLSASSDQIVPIDHSLAILCPFREEKNPAISRLGASFPDLEPTSALDALANDPDQGGLGVVAAICELKAVAATGCANVGICLLRLDGRALGIIAR
jgi:hypothetical protein